MKKYESYKITKNIWYRKIPSHWAVCKVKHIANPYAGGTPSTVKPDYWENGKIPWLPSGKLQNREIISAEKFITELGLNKSSTKWIKPNTVLIALTGATCANIGYLTFRACANQSVVAIDENNAKSYSRYLYYMFLSMRKQILTHQTGGAQAGINNEEVRNLYLLTPSLQEQTQIAKYLDHKTQIIDALIDKKEQLIKKLQAQRQAIINEAVTKGLNKNAKLKDSGIEWLGEIPEHWEVVKLSYLIEVIGGSTPRTNVDEYWDGNIEWVTTDDLGKLKTKNINYARRKITELGLQNCSARVIPKGSVIISCRAPIGYLGILNINASFNQGCKGLIPFNDNIISDYLYYYLLSSKKELESLGTGSTFMEISTSNLKNFKILLPTKNEQMEIVNYLEVKTIKMDLLLEKVKNQIKKLKSYRQSIISEVVTGKIDVRDWQAPKK